MVQMHSRRKHIQCICDARPHPQQQKQQQNNNNMWNEKNEI
jgi:hypothetical protein